MRMTRQQLYEWVWRIPASRVALVLSVSPSALVNLCREYSIPTPYRGYWHQWKRNLQVPRKELPNPEDNRLLPLTVDDKVFG